MFKFNGDVFLGTERHIRRRNDVITQQIFMAFVACWNIMVKTFCVVCAVCSASSFREQWAAGFSSILENVQCSWSTHQNSSAIKSDHWKYISIPLD